MIKRRLACCLIPLLLLGAISWVAVRALRAPKPVEERLSTIDRGMVEVKVTESGTIEPLKKVEVKSKVAGRVAQLAVDEGDHVTAGQFLAAIDPTEINSQVAQIRAQWDGARSRGEQSQRAVAYQVTQTRTGIEQARANLLTAQSRLQVAQEANRAQPALTAGEIAQAEAALRSAQQSADLLRASGHPQAIVQAQTAFEEARTAEANARRSVDRQKSLLARGFVSEQAVDAAENELAASRARLEQARKKSDLIGEQNRLELASAETRIAEARAGLDRARAGRVNIPIKEQEVASARAAVSQARSQLAAAIASQRQDEMRHDEVRQARASAAQVENQLREVEVRQHDTTLVAPMAGVVTRRYVEAGELVTSGVSTFSSGTPVLQVADLSRMLVKMTVNEVDVNKVRVGLPVEIAVDGARDAQFTGRVRRVATASGSAQSDAQSAAASGSVIRYAVEVEVSHPDGRLRPGMTARCSIIVARRPNVVRIPINCVTVKGKAVTATVSAGVPKGSPGPARTEERKLDPGLYGDAFVEVRSGVRPGEKVKPSPFGGPKRQGFDLQFGG